MLAHYFKRFKHKRAKDKLTITKTLDFKLLPTSDQDSKSFAPYTWCLHSFYRLVSIRGHLPLVGCNVKRSPRTISTPGAGEMLHSQRWAKTNLNGWENSLVISKEECNHKPKLDPCEAVNIWKNGNFNPCPKNWPVTKTKSRSWPKCQEISSHALRLVEPTLRFKCFWLGVDNGISVWCIRLDEREGLLEIS